MLPPARPSAPAITDLHEVWPAVAARLQRLLAARGVAPEAADDICQEVAFRVVSRQVPYESADDLYRWAATVARRLSIDLHRTQRHIALVEPPERVADVDIPSLVEARARLRAVAAAMPQLSEHDRTALTAVDAGPAATRKEAVRLAVRRHRARARLMAMVEAAGAVLAWLAARWPGRRAAKPALAVAGAVAPAVLLAWSLSPVPSDRPGPLVRETARPLQSAAALTADATADDDKPGSRPWPAPGTPSRSARGAPVTAPRAHLVVEPAVPGQPPVGRAALRPRTEADSDACVFVGEVRLCANATDPLLDLVRP